MNDAASSPPTSLAPEIELWFDFGSNYSYLSVMRIEKLTGQPARLEATGQTFEEVRVERASQTG